VKTLVENLERQYINLAFNLEQHAPGFVDAYIGPEEWRQAALAQGKRLLSELESDAFILNEKIRSFPEMDEQRREFFASEVKAMLALVKILQGTRLPLADEAEALFGIRPEWVDESVFTQAHQDLEKLLPPGGSLAGRLAAWKKTVEVPVEKVRDLLPQVVEILRNKARQRFPLPADESFEIFFVQDKPWGGYNYFLGGGRSRIEINTDLPLLATFLLDILAHEGYPGHHTELCIKEDQLVKHKGWLEHSINLLNTPVNPISEGIATRALDQLFTQEEQVALEKDLLFPGVGLKSVDVHQAHSINRVLYKFSGVAGNAAFLLHDHNASPDEAAAYLMQWELVDPQEAAKTVEFISEPLYRSYIFNYSIGRALLGALLEKKTSPDRWFIRLLSEPVTPQRVLTWIEEPDNLSEIS
jgi:hypothetical protein